jgi:hypothetical protein
MRGEVTNRVLLGLNAAAAPASRVEASCGTWVAANSEALKIIE